MSKKILIIEDDFETQFLFSELLQNEGYEVKTVGNGKEALDALNEGHSPSIIFMDLNFPGGTPEELMTYLKDHPRSQDVPVYVISGSADIAGHTNRLGATGFVRKPFEIDPLLDLVKNAI